MGMCSTYLSSKVKEKIKKSSLQDKLKCINVTVLVASQLPFQIRIAALNASSTIEDDYEGTFKSHKTQTKEAQVSKSRIFLINVIDGNFVLFSYRDWLSVYFLKSCPTVLSFESLNYRKQKLLLCTTKLWTSRSMTALKSLPKLIMSCSRFVFCERSVLLRE